MKEQLYQLIMEGTIKEGLYRNEVVGRLSSVFKQDRHIVEKLLSGKPRVVKKDLDLTTARRYQEIIERAGAVVRVERAAGEGGAPLSPEEPRPPVEVSGTRCPRCGYQPRNEDDVLLIRGDCPRCGLWVRKSEQFGAAGEESATEEDPFFSEDTAEDNYPERTAATLKRRALASIYTFGLFVAVYWCVVVAYVAIFFPVELVLRQIFRWLPETALNNFPMLLTAVSIFVVSFLMPLTNQGRSWGQRKLEIGILYRKEFETGGLILSLSFRLGAIALLTYAPGLTALYMAKVLGFAALLPYSKLTMVGMAMVAWGASWLFVIGAPDKRGLLDRAGGTIQVEETLLPQDALNIALTPLVSALAFFVVVGLLIPMVFKYFTL